MTNFPKRPCKHENCPGSQQLFGLGGEHGLCRETLNSEGVTCGTAKHKLYFDILDHGVEKTKISPDTFFSDKTHHIVQDITSTLSKYEDGMSLDRLIGFINQLDEVPGQLILALALNIAVDVENQWIYSIYKADNSINPPLKTFPAVFEYLHVNVGNTSKFNIFGLDTL